MAPSSDSKSQALHMISESAGFSFKEEELSPDLRKKITDVAVQLDHYHSARAELSEKEAGESKESGGGCWCFLSGLIGLVVLVWGITSHLPGSDNMANMAVGFGIVLVIMIGGLWGIFKGSSLAGERGKVDSLWSAIEGQVDELAKEVENELAAVQEAKVRPTVRHIVIDFAKIIQAAKGKGIILDRVECPHCGGAVAIPESGEYIRCEYCGKTVYASNIFDKLKDILSPAKD